LEVEIMPKVTLLTDPGRSYCVPFGKSNYVFEGGKPLNVPTAIALFCKGKKDTKGRRIFEVEEIENVVTPASPPVPEKKQNVEKEIPPKVLGNFTQLRLIEAELCH
jgi:hypothetical protein